jgi:hypothetical protein
MVSRWIYRSLQVEKSAYSTRSTKAKVLVSLVALARSANCCRVIAATMTLAPSAVDSFSLVNLAQRVPGRADREEQVRIGVAAGGILTPVHAYGHRPGPSWLVSADDAQGELRRAAIFHQPGNLMPVDAVGVDLGQ